MKDAHVLMSSESRTFLAAITARARISSGTKDTRLITLDISRAPSKPVPGDSIAIYPENDANEVAQILALTADRADAPVTLKDGTVCTFEEALKRHWALNVATKNWIKAAADPALETIAQDSEQFKVFQENNTLLEILQQYPPTRNLSAQTYAEMLNGLRPRLYSIASSCAKDAEHIDLVVAVVAYEKNGRQVTGVSSGFLSERAPMNNFSLRAMLHSSKFRLPADDVDMIMIGPGAGVAPFRAFMQERAAHGCQGRNWLFFGDQHKATDFLFEQEWEAYLQSGLLTRLDVAFSRDQAHKIYVQDRMRETGELFWSWLQNGAHVYVCGDAKRMAKDVDAALLDIVQKYGQMSPETAADYVKNLRQNARYQKDVY